MERGDTTLFRPQAPQKPAKRRGRPPKGSGVSGHAGQAAGIVEAAAGREGAGGQRHDVGRGLTPLG